VRCRHFSEVPLAACDGRLWTQSGLAQAIPRGLKVDPTIETQCEISIPPGET